MDNGSEFISKALDKWAYEHEVVLAFSRPGKPTDNAYIESFNGSFRDYNFERPHSALNYQAPSVFAAQLPDQKVNFSILE